MTRQELIKKVISLLQESEVSLSHSEADGNSDYDYYSGEINAYMNVLRLLQKVEDN